MELKDFIDPLLKWWWLLITSALVAALSSFIAVQQQPPIFEASTVLMIGRALDDPNPSGNEIWLGQQLSSTYADIAKRSPVRQATMDSLGLTWLPEYTVRPINNTQNLAIEVTDVDPVRAQAVANELANQLIQKSPTNPTRDQERQAFIDQQLDDLQESIQNTQEDVSEKQAELANMISARQIADSQNQIAALESKLNTLQSNYAGLLSNTNQGALNTLTVIEPASLPSKPVGPNVLLTVLTASSIGLLLASAAAYLLEYLDNTIKTSEDVGKIVDIPVLAGIPPIRGEHYNEQLITLNHPRSPISETFRSLRTAIQFSTIDSTENSSILISSPNPTEGKSVSVMNLGVVVAQAGNEVLIIDSDLRRPVLHRFFELSNSRGLTSFLIEVNLDQLDSEIHVLENKIIHNTPVEGLRILTSGPIPPNPSELLGSEKMRTTISALKRRYDYIILDSPPIMVVTDAAVLSTLASSVLLITDADKTQSNHLKQAVDHFREVNANLIGIVLNRISIRNDGYYSSKWKYYDKSYGYGYHQGSITTNINGRNLANLVRKILKIK